MSTFRLLVAMTLSALALLTALTGCKPRVEAPAAAPTRVVNADLGVAIAALPAEATVIANQGERLEIDLGPADSATRCQVEVGPQQRGVNLVEEVRGQKAIFEALQGGEYAGNTELMTPLGPAYAARGRFDGGEGRVEELRVLTLHPSGDRLLVLRCAYPRTDDEGSKARFGPIIALLAEVEAADPAGGHTEG